MASVHKHKQRVLRGIDDQLAAEFDAFARQLGGDRSSITRQLWEWCVGRPGAELPERPKPTEESDQEDPAQPDA